MEAVAYRDIEPGEELSISCKPPFPAFTWHVLTWGRDVPLGYPTEARKTLLHRQWDFNCTCYLCRHPEESEPSDIRKRRIQKILALMEDRASLTFEKLEGFAVEMRGLIEDEGMLMQIGSFYSTLARTFYEMGHLTGAVRYGELALETLREYIGEDSEQVTRAREFLDEATRIIKTGG